MNLAPRDRRALLVGVLSLVAILAYASIVQPMVREAADLNRRRELAVEFLSRYRSVLEARAAYESTLDTAAVRLSRLAPRAFHSRRAEASVSQLLELLEKAAARNFVRVLRTTPAPVDSAGAGVLRISAAVESESDLTGILGLLRSLETTEKLLHVTDLRISEAGAGSASTSPVETLRFNFTVHGFVVAATEER